MAKQHLSAQDWVRAAFEILAQKGARGVTVEGVARHIGATKGSFYWHFKNRDALRDQMLSLWESLTAGAELEAALEGLEPSDQLARMLAHPVMPGIGSGIGAAWRDWARADAQVAQVLARIDRRRMSMMGEILGAMGCDTARLPLVFHAAQVGLDALEQSLGAVPAASRDALMRMIPGRHGAA